MSLTDLTDTQLNFINKYILSIPTSRLPAEECDTGDGENTVDGSPNFDAWATLQTTLAPRVLAAIEANHPDAQNMRAAWDLALKKAEGRDNEAAIEVGEGLASMLDTTNLESTEREIPHDVVAFQRSRIIWIETKRDMKKDLDSFRLAVVKQAEDDHDKADIIATVDGLIGQFAAFDERLEEHLDLITQTAEGPERTRLKQEAHAAVQNYMAALEGPFFSAIDDNPFVPVNVTARGRQSLSTIRATLT